MNKSITISPRFFEQELKGYACHRRALVREMLQNSVDSRGCSKIEFECGEDWISVKDNGRGMDRETLESKFLTMGETGKGGGEMTVGGFGKAKILIGFAQEGYEIYSHDYRLEGIGGDYEIFDNKYTRGCYFKIKTKQANWIYEIKRVLKNCSLRQTVTINGEEHRSEISRGRWARSLTFGEVWVNKSQDPKLIVRVNGVWMFDCHTDAKAQIIIEITPEDSRDILLSNRDSLVWEKQRELNGFCNELASESMSALKTKNRNYFNIMKAGTALYAGVKVKPQPVIKETKAMPVRAYLEECGVDKIAAAMENTRGIEIVGGANLNKTEYYGEAKQEEVSFYAEKWLEATAVAMDSDNPEIQKVAKLYDPQSWKGGETRMKLLKIWKMAVEVAAECYTAITNQPFSYCIGWLFSDDAEAQYRTAQGVPYILINPLDKENKIKYSVNKRESVAELLVLAVHEISHMASNCHNESFACMMTDVMKGAMKAEGDLWRRVREEK